MARRARSRGTRKEGSETRVTEPGTCILGHTEPTEAFIGYACKRHYSWMIATLDEIVTLYALLPVVLLPGSGGEERTATQVDSPAPGRLSVMSVTDRRVAGRKPPMTFERNWNGRSLEPNGSDDDVHPLSVLGGWFQVILEELQPGWADGLPQWVTLTDVVKGLRRERRWVAQQEWVDLFCEEIGDVHRVLARAIGDSMWPRPVGKCPACTRPLYNTIGLDEVTCRHCRITWTGVALARLRLIHEQEETRRPVRSTEQQQEAK